MRALAILILLLAAVNITAQTPASCRNGKNAPAFGFWTWGLGSTVKVYVLIADFDASELPYLTKPLLSWNAAMTATGSRVKFDYAGFTEAPRYCQNCLTIMRGQVFDKVRRHATALHAYSARSDQILTWAHIVVDHALTNPKAITNAVAHELGHSLGLLDCYDCKSGTTVMNKFDRFNQPNGMEDPTACDTAQVRAAYRELAAQVRPAPVTPEVGDEGEEPIDDDTPVIIRKP
jgi:hypothetical protein